MTRYLRIALIGNLILFPTGVWAQETLDALISELNLEQIQIDKIQRFLDEFAQE